MAINFDELDALIDIESIIAEEETESGGDYPEVPLGTYDVEITKMEIGKAKSSGNPKAEVWFKILAGEYKGSVIFMNQALTMNFHFGIINRFLRSLESGLDERVKKMKLKEYNELMMDILEAIDGKLEYGLEYGENRKGFKTYEITDVYEV